MLNLLSYLGKSNIAKQKPFDPKFDGKYVPHFLFWEEELSTTSIKST